MKTKPSLHKVKELVPEAGNLEEVASGGFKVVYKALVNDKLEAVKLVEIPADETDSSVRDENVRRVKREVDILGKCTNPCLVKLGSIAPRPCEIDATEYGDNDGDVHKTISCWQVDSYREWISVGSEGVSYHLTFHPPRPASFRAVRRPGGRNTKNAD